MLYSNKAVSYIYVTSLINMTLWLLKFLSIPKHFVYFFIIFRKVMKKTAQKQPTNHGTNQLTKKQRNALDYWNGATSQLEKTTYSILDLLHRNNDKENYTKYKSQYDRFKNMHNLLSKNVDKAIQSNNLQHIESVIGEAVKILKEMVYLHSEPSGRNPLQRTMSEEYDEALLALRKCMIQLRKKLKTVDKCLTRLSAEMTLYSALGKELQSLMEATVKAKKNKRENVASTIIALAPDVMSYIQT